MQNASKIATLFIAVSMFATPAAAANAGIGDNVFSWPSGMSDKNTVTQERAQFGTTETLQSVTPVKTEVKEKKQ